MPSLTWERILGSRTIHNRGTLKQVTRTNNSRLREGRPCSHKHDLSLADRDGSTNGMADHAEAILRDADGMASEISGPSRRAPARRSRGRSATFHPFELRAH